MRYFLLSLLITLLPVRSWASAGTVFYVCAHPDDCVLFMTPNLYNDITQNSDKIIVIYLTSGDAGEAFEKDDESYPYVRELAALEATDWMADIDEDSIDAERETEEITIRGHDIDRVSYENTASYFLRLPDGNMYGEGFDRYGHQSMNKLKTGAISQLNAIDGDAIYKGWGELVAVLADIFRRETQGENDVAIHVQEPDATISTSDHSDHGAGASAMIEALERVLAEDAAANHCYRLYKHIDYSISEMAPNLDATELQNKAGSFAIVSGVQRRFFGAHHWDKAHLPYLSRNYFSATMMPSGCSK